MTDREGMFQLVDRPLWVVTAGGPEHRSGLLATWCLQTSLPGQPPTMMLGLAPNHFTTRLVLTTGRVACHLLCDDQVDLALRFCRTSGRDGDKLAGVSLLGESPPVLEECRAWITGRLFARLPAGDRVYCWIDILDGGPGRVAPVLTELGLWAALDEAAGRELAELCRRDVEWLEPRRADWKGRLPAWLLPPAGNCDAEPTGSRATTE